RATDFQARRTRAGVGFKEIAHGSILIRTDYFPASNRAQRAPDGGINGVLDPAHAAVTERCVHTSRVLAGRGQRHVGWTAVVLIRRVPVHLHDLAPVREAGCTAQCRDIRIWRHCGGKARVVDAAVAPSGMPNRSTSFDLAAGGATTGNER